VRQSLDSIATIHATSRPPVIHNRANAIDHRISKAIYVAHSGKLPCPYHRTPAARNYPGEQRHKRPGLPQLPSLHRNQATYTLLRFPYWMKSGLPLRHSNTDSTSSVPQASSSRASHTSSATPTFRPSDLVHQVLRSSSPL
jgi:hypothetical protein